MPHALIAFDLDGTLADTESFSIPNLVELLHDAYNITITAPEWLQRYHGMSGPSLIQRLNTDFGTNISWEEFLPRRLHALEQVIRARGVEPMPGALQMLRRIVTSGQQIALVSNSTPTRIGLTLEFINGQRQHGLILPTLFEGHIFSGTDPAEPNRQSKPAPDVYVAAAHYYQALPAACLAVEDSTTGVTAAVSAGFNCWGYTGASTNPSEATEALRAAGASHIFHHWDEFRP